MTNQMAHTWEAYNIIIIIIIIIMEAFIKRRIPGKTTCSKALQYNSNKVVVKLKLY